jgi:hypothetical protein
MRNLNCVSGAMSSQGMRAPSFSVFFSHSLSQYDCTQYYRAAILCAAASARLALVPVYTCNVSLVRTL